MTQLDAKLLAVGAMWGGADYERVARLFAPIHDRLVDALEPQPGDRWLDLATGTGEVALRAARRGAVVTGVDISERLLAQAAAKAGGQQVVWELADIQHLPYGDASFDALSSCFGVIFPPDREAVAGELARVTRPGGRLGLTAWVPDEEFDSLWEPFVDEPQPRGRSGVWGDADGVQELLGADFDVSVEPGEWVVEHDSPEALWELFVSAAPPLKALHDSLEPHRRGEMRRVFLAAHERYRTNGGLRVTQDYILVLGRRR